MAQNDDILLAAGDSNDINNQEDGHSNNGVDVVDVDSFYAHSNLTSSAETTEAGTATDTTSRGISSSGSSMAGAVFNFTNCIIGAGAIGLGGAFAESGGLVSVISVLTFAFLTKLSLDMVIRLSIQHGGSNTGVLSYEELGFAAFGYAGRAVIILSKLFYSFGCLVAYVVVIKDNMAPALTSLLKAAFHGAQDGGMLWKIIMGVLRSNVLTTWAAAQNVLLPLCLLRDMTPLAFTSFLSVAAMLAIVAIVIYCYVADIANIDNTNSPNYFWREENYHYLQQQQLLSSNSFTSLSELKQSAEASDTATGIFPLGNRTIPSNGGNATDTFYDDWLEIHWSGYLQSLGTFVFCFVSQHTVHLAFKSLKPDLQTLKHWKTVSSWSLLISCSVSLSVGITVYLTFGQAASSDVFEMYPSSSLIVDAAKLLLCVTMMLTFPLPFFTCRELLIGVCFGGSPSNRDEHATNIEEEESNRDNNDPITEATEETPSEVAGIPRSSFFFLARNNADIEELREPLLTNKDGDAAYNQDEDDHNHLERGEQPSITDTTTTITTATTTPSEMTLLDRQQQEVSQDSIVRNVAASSFLLPGPDLQLRFLPHVFLTVLLWVIAVSLACLAPNLGDVLDLVGCVTGTCMAFVAPALIALKLESYSLTAAIILSVGGIVGTVGTFFSVKKLVTDMDMGL